MYKQFWSMPLLAATICGGIFAPAAFAGENNGNTVVNTTVTNTLATGGRTTTVRNSTSRIENAGPANVHNDININLSGSCGRSSNTNNVSHQGSVGANVNVNVDVCNPAAGGGRQRGR
jgi:hypothetical protein